MLTRRQRGELATRAVELLLGERATDGMGRLMALDRDGQVVIPRRVSGPCEAWPEDTAFIREVLDRIGDKWTVLIISTLGGGLLRYSELQASIPGISQRMLARTLKNLGTDGLITRTAYAEVPPRVGYMSPPATTWTSRADGPGAVADEGGDGDGQLGRTN